MQPTDRLTLVELNEDFVRHLRGRFENEPAFAAVAQRAEILHTRLEDLPKQRKFDLIISGLPLNNFEVTEVEQILGVFERLLAPGGTLSFFEYIAIRRVKSLVSGRTGRKRLRGIGAAIGSVLDGREIKRDWVWPNVPPAWVHHVSWQNDKR
jgi:phospholipid N-methyltransferase